MDSSKTLFLVILIIFQCLHGISRATDVSHDGRAIKINGQRRVLISGSIHYPRSTPSMWPDLIAKAKEGGLDAIETYVFWNAHEPTPGKYNFEGNLDLVRFIKEIQNAGLYSILRIGPYVCAEWNLGGLPAWLRQIPGMEFRTDNQPFKNEMQKFTTLIVDMLKNEKLLAPQGGPIILTQIENEYGNIMDGYGEAGKRYINWSAKMAEALNVGVPWIMCQQSDAPQPMINTCNGFYCNDFKPNNANSPKIWTENWTGWFKAWDLPDPHRPAEDLAYSVARFFVNNGTLQNYYMYHGGTNFGRTTGGPYITTSYDYDAPLDEYGNIRQPKWGHLKNLHAAIKQMENAIVYGDRSQIELDDLSVTKFSIQNGTSGCFLHNKNNATDSWVKYDGAGYFLPAWSISILPDCKTEVFNTAKITAQTSVMVKKPSSVEDETTKVSWKWKPEIYRNQVHGKKPVLTKTKLLEQVPVSADVSDYLWYITSVDVNQESDVNMILRVNSTGHGLHVFLNGVHVGYQYSKDGPFNFTSEFPVTIKKGTNDLALLSSTVGLKNYGAFYEKTPTGIINGPVQLVAPSTSGNKTFDLSNNRWRYMIGLDSEKAETHVESYDQGKNWRNSTHMVQFYRPFTWYKATFQAPLGTDPVVVDLLGMGKGEAWVNGNSIGRYWANYIAKEDGCTEYNYRGEFTADRAYKTGCGEVSQRYYHVPREFLYLDRPNTLTLFEEIGGNTSAVNFKTVVVGKICGTVFEKESLTLACPGTRISKIEFASFGDSKGTCESFSKGSCESSLALDKVQQACVGSESCTVTADESLLGETGACEGGAVKRLSVQAVCS
nr:beta-galactosidase-like protein [Allium cepa]